MSRGAAAAACAQQRKPCGLRRTAQTGGAAAARRCAQSRFGAVRRAAYDIVLRHRVKNQSTCFSTQCPQSTSSSLQHCGRRRCGARADTHGLHEEESKGSGACEYDLQIQPCLSAAHHTLRDSMHEPRTSVRAASWPARSVRHCATVWHRVLFAAIRTTRRLL